MTVESFTPDKPHPKGIEVAYVVSDEVRQVVTREPTEAEPWHGGIHGTKTNSVKKKLAAAATAGMLVAPERD